MFFSTLPSFLLPLFQLFGPMFEDANAGEPDQQPTDQPAEQHTDQTADEPNPDEPGDNDEEPEDVDDPDLVRGNAARKISDQGQDMRADDLALLSLLAEAPSKAPRIIAMLQDSNPKQAARIAKLVSKNDADLADRLKDADPLVRDALQELSTTVQQLSKKTENEIKSNETRVFKTWRTEKAPFLSPKTEEGKTPLGKRLRDTFQEALDTLFPADAPLTEDMLEDALAVAKRRTGWQESKVKRAVDKQAAEQAQKARAASTPKGGTGIAAGQLPPANPRIAGMFGRKTPEQMKQIQEAKKNGGFK